MAGQNDFLIFDENKDNMLTQELYSIDGDRTDGFKKGLARSNVNNKVLHQTSMMCHVLGEIIKDKDLKASDNGTVEELKQALLTAFSSQGIIEQIYPVGSIYMSVNEVNPSTLFGFGEWEQIKDTFLLASGDNYPLASIGGEANHSLTVEEMPTHTHSASTNSTGGHAHSRGSMEISGGFRPCVQDTGGSSAWGTFGLVSRADTGKVVSGTWKNADPIPRFDFLASRSWSGSTSTNGTHAHTVTVNNTGNSNSHNNMPPYLAVNIWKRIA